MIEVIYKEEKVTADEEVSSFSIPRNIRQVGLVGENFRIYMEDYVYTFLKKLSEKKVSETEQGSLAILKGETHWKNEVTYVFVRGAVWVKNSEASAEHITLSENIWEQIRQDEEEYFPDAETVGWFYSEPDLPMCMNSTFDCVHLKYFGADKICMLMDPTEKDEAFFRYENSSLIRQCGYYLYYERNPEMRNYMVDKKEELSDVSEEIPDDEAVRAFRKRVVEHSAEDMVRPQKLPRHNSFFSYAATACLAFAVLAAGLNFYRNYRQVEQAEYPEQQVSSDSVVIASLTPASEGPGDAKTKSADQKSDSPENAAGEPAAENDQNAGKVNVQTTAGEEADPAKISDVWNVLDAWDHTDTEAEDTGETGKYAESGTAVSDSGADTEMRADENVQREDTADAGTGRGGETGTDSGSKSSAENTSAASSPMHETYVIRPGDTLFQICLEHYGTLDRLGKLCELNGLSENDLIYPGEIIVLP